GKFLAAICARTAENLSGAGCGLDGVSAAKAWVANSSALRIKMRWIAVFMVGSVVWVERHRRRRLPALTRPIPERMQREREKLPNYQSLTQCPDKTKSPDGLPPGFAGAASMLTASCETLKKSFSEVSASATVPVPLPRTTPTGTAALPSLGRAHSWATEPAGMATGCSSFTVITVPWRLELASTVGLPAASIKRPT